MANSRLTLFLIVSTCAWTSSIGQSLPSVDKLQGIWRGNRTSMGYMIGSPDGSWQVGCSFDVADRFSRNNITIIDLNTYTSTTNVVLEVGGYDVDLTWHFDIPTQLIRDGYAVVSDIQRWLHQYNVTIAETVGKNVQFDTSEPQIGGGPAEGCQTWDLTVPTNSSQTPAILKSYEVFEVTVYSDGSLLFDTPCPAENTTSQFCNDSRVSQEQRDEFTKRRAERLARIESQKKNGVVNNGYFGKCLDPDTLNSADMTDDSYIQTQLNDGGSVLNRCLDYLSNGLKSMYQNKPESVQGTLRECFDTMNAAATFAQPRDALTCLDQFRNFFDTQIGDTQESRVSFCATYPTCQVCDFCTYYQPTGDDCSTCGGNAPPPPYSAANGWDGYDPYATAPPTYTGRRRLLQGGSYTIRIGSSTLLTCTDGPCLFLGAT